MKHLFDVTPEQIRAGWEIYGDGTPMKDGFPEWLADHLNAEPEFIPPPRFPAESIRANTICGSWMSTVSPLATLVGT
jgi:hypothetical protein